MAFLLDTTVLVDIARRRSATLDWFARQSVTELYTSTITLGELHRGVHQRHAGDPAAVSAGLRQLQEDTLLPLEGRILPFDQASAEIWGRLMGEGAARGLLPPADDAKIAAIALRHGLTVASSNTAQLAALVDVVDPRRPSD